MADEDRRRRGATLRGVLATWQEAQEETDPFTREEWGDYADAGSVGGAMLPVALAYVQAGRESIDAVAALLLASRTGRLSYADVAAMPRHLEGKAFCETVTRAQRLLATHD